MTCRWRDTNTRALWLINDTPSSAYTQLLESPSCADISVKFAPDVGLLRPQVNTFVSITPTTVRFDDLLQARGELGSFVNYTWTRPSSNMHSFHSITSEIARALTGSGRLPESTTVRRRMSKGNHQKSDHLALQRAPSSVSTLRCLNTTLDRPAQRVIRQVLILRCLG
jgi:hypothetical protein